MRNSLVILHNAQTQKIHFCSTELRGQDRWFSFTGNENELFAKVEELMVDNGIAHNVTSVQFLRRCGSVNEYQVVYNELSNSAVGSNSVAVTPRLSREEREALTGKPTIFFDVCCDDEYPKGCFMCGFSGEDHYLGNSIPEALSNWLNQTP